MEASPHKRSPRSTFKVRSVSEGDLSARRLAEEVAGDADQDGQLGLDPGRTRFSSHGACQLAAFKPPQICRIVKLSTIPLPHEACL
jgi:hypothetical protein